MGKNLGLKIKHLRSEYSLKTGKRCTQEDLSKMIGISRSYLGDIESGRTNASDEVLKKLAKVFNIDAKELLDYKFKELNEEQLKEECDLFETGEFKTPEAAMQFILKQPAIMGYGGFDVNKMSNEDIIEFANELLNQLKLLSYKYNK